MPARKRKYATVMLIIVAAIIVVVSSRNMSRNGDSSDAQLAGVLLDEPLPLAAFTLTDNNNQLFTLDGMRGKWTFVFFGYTHCPDICPVTFSELAKMYEQLSVSGQNTANVQVVFVSVDPERDDSKQLDSYVTYFNRDFIGVTGTLDQINGLTRQIGIRHRRLKKPNEENYLVEHSAAIVLIDPASRLVAKFNAPHYAEEIAARFEKIRKLNEVAF
jgi:protein SCO1/2